MAMFTNSLRNHFLPNCVSFLRNPRMAVNAVRLCETCLQRPVFPTALAVKPKMEVKVTKSKESDVPTKFHMERPQLINPGDIDVLFETLEKCQTVDNVLELIEINGKELNARHVALCFQQLFNWNFNEEYKQYLLNTPEFHKLCQLALRKVQFCSPYEVLSIMRLLIALRFDGDTLLMKAVLQMMRSHINDLSSMEIVLFYSLLHNLENKPPICEAFNAALPMLLKIKMQKKEIDLSNVTELCYIIRTAAYCKFDLRRFNQLLWALSDISDEMTAKEASIVYPALKKRVAVGGVDQDSVNILLNHCENILGIKSENENRDVDDDD